MRRHLIGIGLAIVMVLAMFFAGTWGYVRLLRLPAAAGAPLSALPASGGSLLANGNVLAALGALAATAALAGILLAAPRVSALATGLPGLFALAWQALFLLNVHRAVQVIPLRAHAFGAGWEALLFNGILGAAGLAMIIPLFVPSRWRSSGRYAEDEDEVSGYMADLKETVGVGASPRTQAGAGLAGAVPRRGPAPGGPPLAGGAPTAANPPPTGGYPTRPSRTGLVGGPGPGAPRMRPRPYRRPGDM